jgi:hypothetical protein
MKTDRERIPLVLRRTERGLEPRSRQAADLLAQYAVHSDVEVTVRKRRSLPQLRLYWAMLQKRGRGNRRLADGRTSARCAQAGPGLHNPREDMDGTLVLIPDSTQWAGWTRQQFRAFFPTPPQQGLRR